MEQENICCKFLSLIHFRTFEEMLIHPKINTLKNSVPETTNKFRKTQLTS